MRFFLCFTGIGFTPTGVCRSHFDPSFLVLFCRSPTESPIGRSEAEWHCGSESYSPLSTIQASKGRRPFLFLPVFCKRPATKTRRIRCTPCRHVPLGKGTSCHSDLHVNRSISALVASISMHKLDGSYSFSRTLQQLLCVHTWNDPE